MTKAVHFKLKISTVLAAVLISGIATATPSAKQIIYVDYKNRSELSLLKKMDVLGVNLTQQWAEVSVDADEMAALQAKKVRIRKADYRLREWKAAKDGYLNPDQVRQTLTDIHTQYPLITRLFETGKTHRDRSIMALELSAAPGDTNKPVVLFNAMHHAREVMTPEVVLHIAKVLTEKYGRDKEITGWLDNYRIILIPQVNPDGNAIVSEGETMWRKNAYKLKNHTVGVDLNRNYPAYWNYCNGSDSNPNSEIYRGPAAGSEPETKAMMQLVDSLKPVVDISYHSYSELIIYPYGCASVDNPAKDLFHSIGLNMRAHIRDDHNKLNTYAVGSAPDVIYEADGSDIDWMWKEQGVLAYCIEVNASSFRPDYNEWRNITVQRQEGGWQAVLRRMSQSGFRAHVQIDQSTDLRYALKKIEGSRKLAFDGDAPDRTFALRSASGLLYQLTEPGTYEITFLRGEHPVKTMKVEVGDNLVDLGNIEL